MAVLEILLLECEVHMHKDLCHKTNAFNYRNNIPFLSNGEVEWFSYFNFLMYLNEI